jgi:hypothetical protein
MSRTRNNDWEFRHKRWDTHIWTIEEKYDIDLGVRSDMHLNTYLQDNNIKSLNDLITWK